MRPSNTPAIVPNKNNQIFCSYVLLPIERIRTKRQVFISLQSFAANIKDTAHLKNIQKIARLT